MVKAELTAEQLAHISEHHDGDLNALVDESLNQRIANGNIRWIERAKKHLPKNGQTDLMSNRARRETSRKN